MDEMLVVPAEWNAEVRVAYFADVVLLKLLYQEIGTDCVDKSPDLWTPIGTMCMWVADDGLLRPKIEHNDRAIALCRAVGYNVPDVGGVAVFTGGADEAGRTLGLPASIKDAIVNSLMKVGHK